MLVCRLELWKKGSHKHRKLKGIVTIINDGTGSKSKGNYRVIVGSATGSILDTVRLTNFPRQKLNAIDLLFAALGGTKTVYKLLKHKPENMKFNTIGVDSVTRKIQKKVNLGTKALGWF